MAARARARGQAALADNEARGGQGKRARVHCCISNPLYSTPATPSYLKFSDGSAMWEKAQGYRPWKFC